MVSKVSVIGSSRFDMKKDVSDDQIFNLLSNIEKKLNCHCDRLRSLAGQMIEEDIQSFSFSMKKTSNSVLLINESKKISIIITDPRKETEISIPKSMFKSTRL